jgi:hypothetical protein
MENKMETTISRELLDTERRIAHTANLFGICFPLQLEPFVFAIASDLARDYKGGFWHFYSLGNGGFYMAPDSEKQFPVRCHNYYEGVLSADALGIVASLYAYSHLSFADNEKIGRMYSRHYHLLREYMMDHAEVAEILQAID